ncbi:RDD family protein [Gordonia sp. TBRC 11910]|uniref:RDD family protein n=1 Tax=Gordonia asplenii TaxID=2725283 RepID=A0A848KYE9_9ACTN|nr:RDD family protein [Gordonia asplenii]NMO03389.1 RDD family protein [Gordonia asplenii]
MSRSIGSWLSGTQPGAGAENEYQGQDLGLPQRGAGSLATGWTRCGGLLLDWLMAYGIALLIVGGDMQRAATPELAVWFVVGVFTISLFGFTPGQFILGLRVIRVDHGPELTQSIASGKKSVAVGFVRALGRQVLIVFIVPALMNDYNGRALHDRATGTAVVKSR